MSSSWRLMFFPNGTGSVTSSDQSGKMQDCRINRPFVEDMKQEIASNNLQTSAVPLGIQRINCEKNGPEKVPGELPSGTRIWARNRKVLSKEDLYHSTQEWCSQLKSSGPT